MSWLKRLLRSQQGASLIEYSFIAALIAVAIIGVLQLIGSDITNVFSSIDGGFNP